MKDSFLRELDHFLSMMNEEYLSVRKLANKPDRARLMISNDHGHTVYLAMTYKDGRRVRRVINNDRERIYRLAHKAYIKEYARRLRADREIVSKAAKAMLPLDYGSILRALPAHFDLLDPELVKEPAKSAEDFSYPNPSAEVRPVAARLYLKGWGAKSEAAGGDPWEWAAEPYCENTDHPENKTHVTRRGLYCRSKSEALIFEIYMALGLPFHYDETVIIGGQRVSPDFIGVRRDGRFIYHEHCGLTSESYRARTDRKAWLYGGAEIFPGDNLLYTYDDPDGNINTSLIEAQIRNAYRL